MARHKTVVLIAARLASNREHTILINFELCNCVLEPGHKTNLMLCLYVVGVTLIRFSSRVATTLQPIVRTELVACGGAGLF